MQCEAYSLSKLVRLTQKLNFQNPCRNPFYKHIRVVLCKKPLQKTALKIKIPNTCENPFYESFRVVLCKKPLQKTALKIKIPKNMSKSILKIIYSCSLQTTARKNTKYSRNESILKIGHPAKAIAHAKS